MHTAQRWPGPQVLQTQLFKIWQVILRFLFSVSLKSGGWFPNENEANK